MKKFFISLLVSLFAVCASNAQNPQLDIARELAAKLGIVISDSCSKHDVIKHSKAIINRYATDAVGASKSSAVRGANAGCANSAFTNRLRLPDLSQVATPKYYYVKNLKTGEYLRCMGDEKPLGTVATPDDSCKFYFVEKSSELVVSGYFYNIHNRVFSGPDKNTWDTNRSTAFFFNLAENQEGILISSSCPKIDLGNTDELIKEDIGDVWRYNKETKTVEYVPVNAQDEYALWIVEPVVVAPVPSNGDTFDFGSNWYVVRNVGTGKYLHYENEISPMSTVVAPDTCSLFYTFVKDGDVMARSYAAGPSLLCAGTSLWNSEGAAMSFTSVDGGLRFRISDSSSDGFWACDENGMLCTSDGGDDNSIWEFECITNFQEILGLCNNSELYDYCYAFVKDVAARFRSNKRYTISEAYVDIIGLLLYMEQLFDGYLHNNDELEDYASLIRFVNFLQKSYKPGMYDDVRVFNTSYVTVDGNTGEVVAKALTTNGSSLLVNDVRVLVEDEADLLQSVDEAKLLHSNIWQIWAEFPDGLMNSQSLGFYIYNVMTGMYVSNWTNGGVIEMSSLKADAALFSVVLNLNTVGDTFYYTQTYFKYNTGSQKNLYVGLSSAEALGASFASDEHADGSYWLVYPGTATLDKGIYKHASDVASNYSMYLMQNVGLVKEWQYYTTNYPSDYEEYTIDNLLDNKYYTIFRTEGSNDEKHYIQADLGENNGISSVYLYMEPNLSTHMDIPTRVTVSASNSEDGDFEVLVADIELSLLYDMYYFSDPINTKGYRYLRMTVDEVSVGYNDFTLSEYHIYKNDPLVAQAKTEMNAFYQTNYIGDDIVAPAAILMKRKAEYLLEINKDNHSYAPEEGQYPTDKYLALKVAVANFDVENYATIETLKIALDEFIDSQNKPASIPAICILESAWENGYSAGKALGFNGNFAMLDANIWDICQWFRIDKVGGNSNKYLADLFVAFGNIQLPVNLERVYGWENLYGGGKMAYAINVEGTDTYIAVDQGDEGDLYLGEVNTAVTTTENQRAAWYLTPLSDEPIDYVYSSILIEAMAEFGKTMAQAKYYEEGYKAGQFVYVKNYDEDKAVFNQLYNELITYYDMGPVQVVKMFQAGHITEDDIRYLMPYVEAIKEFFPNFVFYNGYFRLCGRESGNHIFSDANGNTIMSPMYGADGMLIPDVELRSIYYTQPCNGGANVNVLSYEDGRYLCVRDGAVKYDRIPQDGENTDDYQIAFVNSSANTLGLNGNYFVDNGTTVSVTGYNDGSDNNKWFIELVDKLPVVISSAKFATFYCPKELQIPAGVTAYVVYGEGKSNGLDYNISTGEVIAQNVDVFNVKPLKGSVIPAGIPVVLHAEDAGTYYFKINYIPTVVGDDARDAVYDDGNDDVVNLLQGRHEATYIPEIENYTHYVLANKDKGVGMYKVATNSSHTSKDGVVTSFATPSFYNNAHRAWLPMPNSISQRASGYVFSLGRNPGTTDIEENVAVEVAEDVVYDLQGRRLNSITVPGVYIVNGKRVFVK